MKKLLLILIVLLIGCESAPKEHYTRHLRGSDSLGFDTYVEVLAYTQTEKEFDDYFKIMGDEIFRLNKIFDNYKSYDDQLSLLELNKKAGQGPVKVSPELIEVLLFSKEMYELGYTKFNPTMGAVLNIWHTYRNDGILSNQNGQPGKTPTLEELKKANACSGWDKINIDATNSSVEIIDPCTRLDLGGVAKGYATEKVATLLEKKGLKYGILNPGGNIRTINTRADGNPWNIAIQKPTLLLDSGDIDVISFNESISMSTSGDYQRAYENEEGIRLHHLIDPDTLMPSHFFRSVTVISKNSTITDYFSTVLFLTDYESGKELIQTYNEKNPEAPLHVLWIIDQETTTESSDFFEVDLKPYKIAITENLQSYSRQYKKHH